MNILQGADVRTDNRATESHHSRTHGRRRGDGEVGRDQDRRSAGAECETRCGRTGACQLAEGALRTCESKGSYCGRDRRDRVPHVRNRAAHASATRGHADGTSAGGAAGRDRPDDRRHRGAAYHRAAVRVRSLSVDRHGLPADVDGVGADLREPVRYPRTQAVLPARRDALRRDLGAVRSRGQADVSSARRHGPADSVSRAAGRRRRDGAGSAVHHRRRHFLAGRTRPLSRACSPPCGAWRRSSGRRWAAGSPTTGRGARASG